MRRIIPTRRHLLIATLAALTTIVMAAPMARAAVTPIGAPLGRKVVTHIHNNDVNQGQGICSAQGQRDDTNGNGIADSLEGRFACLEDHGVLRYRLYFSSLQVFFAGTWVTVSKRETDVVSTSQPAFAVSRTPPDRFCQGDQAVLTYRVVGAVGIRWTDGTLGTRTVASNQFQFRRTQNHPDCPD